MTSFGFDSAQRAYEAPEDNDGELYPFDNDNGSDDSKQAAIEDVRQWDSSDYPDESDFYNERWVYTTKSQWSD